MTILCCSDIGLVGVSCCLPILCCWDIGMAWMQLGLAMTRLLMCMRKMCHVGLCKKIVKYVCTLTKFRKNWKIVENGKFQGIKFSIDHLIFLWNEQLGP